MFVLRRVYCVCVCVSACVMDTICWRRARIRSLIGRFHFGSEFQLETKVNIRNPNQIDKGYLSGQFALAFTQVFAISLFLVARHISWGVALFEGLVQLDSWNTSRQRTQNMLLLQYNNLMHISLRCMGGQSNVTVRDEHFRSTVEPAIDVRINLSYVHTLTLADMREVGIH